MIDKFIRQLRQNGQLYLRIKVRPGAATSQFKQILNEADGEIIKVDIAAPAVKGKANFELINFLARQFAINKNSVKIIGGAGDKLKLVKLEKN